MKMIMWFARLCNRTGAFANRLIQKMIVESDLPVGKYQVVSSKTINQVIRNHSPYSRLSIVKRGERKSWLVLSDSRLSDTFSVIKDGLTNKVVRLEPQKK